ALDLGYVLPLALFVLWTAIVITGGLCALSRFRGHRVPAALASAHLLGTVGVVAVGCFVEALVARRLGGRTFDFIGPVSIMLGIGVAVIALQTRRWFLAPAGAAL